MKHIGLIGIGGLLLLYLTAAIPSLAVPGTEPPEDGGPGNSPIVLGDPGAFSVDIDCGGHVAYDNSGVVIPQAVRVSLKDNCDQLDSEIECRAVKDDPASVTSRKIIRDGRAGTHYCELPPGGAAFVVCNGFDGGCELVVIRVVLTPFGDDRTDGRRPDARWLCREFRRQEVADR